MVHVDAPVIYLRRPRLDLGDRDRDRDRDLGENAFARYLARPCFLYALRP